MPKGLKKIESRTTPNHKMNLRFWLVELLMMRKSKWLPPYFWREQKYKWSYTNEIKAISKFIKKYGESTVALCVLNNRKINTSLSYGELEFLLQREHEVYNKSLSSKDTTEIEDISPPKGLDLRDPKDRKKKKGLFGKLHELEA